VITEDHAQVLDPFRKQALDRLSSPEELDRLVRVSRPGTWIALSGLLLVIVAVVLWATLTNIATTVSGVGYVLPEGGLAEASTLRAGIVERIDVTPGEQVRPGDRVAVLELPGGGTFAVAAPTAGRVGEVLRAIGDFVPQGGQVAVLVPDRPLVVEAFLPVADAKQARVGDQVWIAPTTAPASQFGFARGRVARIGEIPIPDVGVASVLENPARVSTVGALGPVIHVIVDLLPAHTPSGVSWTASRGPSQPVALGTRADVRVVTGQRAPIDYVAG
jgi:multidrug efflux pump subunit AcrA (membrane-fusion protein)